MTIEIATIEKNKTEELQIALKEFKGRHYLDVRTYIEAQRKEAKGG